MLAFIGGCQSSDQLVQVTVTRALSVQAGVQEATIRFPRIEGVGRYTVTASTGPQDELVAFRTDEFDCEETLCTAVLDGLDINGMYTFEVANAAQAQQRFLAVPDVGMVPPGLRADFGHQQIVPAPQTAAGPAPAFMHFGATAAAGDVTGDGVPEVVVASVGEVGPLVCLQNRGSGPLDQSFLFVFSVGADGLVGPDFDDRRTYNHGDVGYGLAVGDLDNDGIGEIAVGDIGGGLAGEGVVELHVTGGAPAFSATPILYTNPEADTALGSDIAVLPDPSGRHRLLVGGFGYDDVLAGVSNVGVAKVLSAASTGPVQNLQEQAVILSGLAIDDYNFGGSVATGLLSHPMQGVLAPGLVIGAPAEVGAVEGAAHSYIPDGAGGFDGFGPATGDQVGARMGAAVDIALIGPRNDPQGVFVAGQPAAELGATVFDTEASNSTPLPLPAGAPPLDAQGTWWGLGVGAVDLNGDGLDEVMVGAPYYQGRAFVYYSDETTLDLSADEMPARPGSGQGFSVNSAGDLNADGSEDVLIGAPCADSPLGAIQSGELVVQWGAPARGVVPAQLANVTGAIDTPVATEVEFFPYLPFGAYDCVVNWGDGSPIETNGCTSEQLRDLTHEYEETGVYLMRIEVHDAAFPAVYTVMQAVVCIGESFAGLCSP